MRTALKIASLAAAALLATTSASAQIQTFASFSSTAVGTNFRWARLANTDSVNGRTVNFFTTSSATGAASGVAGSTPVSLVFQNLGLFGSTVGSVNARLFITGTVTNTAATSSSGNITQTALNGSFSIVSLAPIVYNNISYATTNYTFTTNAAGTTSTSGTGSNILTGTFNNVVLTGSGTSAGINGSTGSAGQTITFTSDFLTFAPAAQLDLAFSLSGATPSLVQTLNRALGSAGANAASNVFRATIGGSFASDPPPTPPAIPEPGTWAMMIAGMGLVGFARRRRRTAVAA